MQVSEKCKSSTVRAIAPSLRIMDSLSSLLSGGRTTLQTYLYGPSAVPSDLRAEAFDSAKGKVMTDYLCGGSPPRVIVFRTLVIRRE